ncbi:hypothetical protein [Nevskia ramosa]|uniref:hypothetical protein n=1 Tax=Nevskia ramosa TaxID=64002 RepID=UPI0023579053|nr:hypothetical protein [Nevskia ramosa]
MTDNKSTPDPIDPAILEKLRQSQTPEGKAKAAGEMKEYRAILGELVMAWNVTEDLMRFLIQLQLGFGNRKAMTLFAGLGGDALENAFRRLANEHAKENIREALIFSANFFSNLRVKRNYYIHGLVHFASEPGGEFIGAIHSVVMKNNVITAHREFVKKELLMNLIKDAESLRGYLGKILQNMMPVRDASGGIQPSPDLKDRPQIPESLKKPSEALPLDGFRDMPPFR